MVPVDFGHKYISSENDDMLMMSVIESFGSGIYSVAMKIGEIVYEFRYLLIFITGFVIGYIECIYIST
jgi:hypothetical protein